MDRAVRARRLDHQPELLVEAPVARGRRLPALEAERRVGDGPPVVEPADDVLGGTAGIREEDLVELGGAVRLSDRTNLDARLVHRHQQV